MRIRITINCPSEELSFGNGIIVSRDMGWVEVIDSKEITEYASLGYIETDGKIEATAKQSDAKKEKQDNNEVWVFAEVSRHTDSIARVSLELLGKATQLASVLNVKVGAVLLSENGELAKELISHGADKVYLLKNEIVSEFDTLIYTKTVVEAIQKYQPQIVLFGATHIGRDLAPRIARRLDTGLTADCTGLDINEKGDLLQTRPAFGGNLMAQILCKKRPQMATVRSGVMQILPEDTTRNGEIINLDVKIEKADSSVAVKSHVKSDKKIVNLEQAQIIVAGGRGIGSQENFEKIYSLAKTLNAEVGATRAVVDAGWIEKNHQVGQTGKTVRPKVYLAFGISGAIQHTVAISNSDYIIAVNKDPQAPIFKVADQGYVADANEFLSVLLEELQR